MTTEFRSHVQLILDRAVTEPDRVVLADAVREITARELAAAVAATAGDLAARGIRAGLVIALAAPITIDAVVVRYAAGRLGASTVVVPNADDPARLAAFLHITGADVLICFPSTAHVTAGLRPECPVRIEHVTASCPTARGPIADRPVDPDATAVIITSGGTTGASKASRRSFADWLRAIAGPLTPDRRQLICTPLPYIAQLLLDQTLLAGGTVILRPRFEPAAVLETIEAERITHLCLVEPRLVELADHPDVARRELSSLVAISHIGADAAPSLRARLADRMGPYLAHPYGASEAGLISVVTPDAYRAAAARGTVGRVLPGVEVRIEGADGLVRPAGAEGRIVVRSAGVAAGYAGSSDSAAFRADGRYDTGDRGFLDASGELHLRGRAKDRRIVAGVATYPVDLQDAGCAQPEVAYAVALPARDEAAGFDVVVVARAGRALDLARLRTAMTARLGRPAIHQLVGAERIPLTEQGKPDRVALRRLLDRAAEQAAEPAADRTAA